jgi:hypothetical protein
MQFAQFAALRARHRFGRALGLHQQAARARQQHGAGMGQRDAAPLAFEQAGAQALLKCMNLLA